MVFQYLEEVYKKDGDSLFSRACCARTRGGSFELKEDKFIVKNKEDIFLQ